MAQGVEGGELGQHQHGDPEDGDAPVQPHPWHALLLRPAQQVDRLAIEEEVKHHDEDDDNDKENDDDDDNEDEDDDDVCREKNEGHLETLPAEEDIGDDGAVADEKLDRADVELADGSAEDVVGEVSEAEIAAAKAGVMLKHEG